MPAGFLIFLCLTAATVSLKPAPLDLSPAALLRLEQRLYQSGKANLAELAQVGWGGAGEGGAGLGAGLGGWGRDR